MANYRTSPDPDRTTMPPGIPYIIGNEAAERFSFYGMRAILVVFMTKYLWLMNSEAGEAMNRAQANEKAHWFMMAVYLTPLLGGIIADAFFGKYRTIISLSIVYCAGHGALALMGIGGEAAWWLVAGLALISIGSGGIKPCVSAHVGDQFGQSNGHLVSRIFNWFYFSINVGAFSSTLLTPWLLEWYGPHWAFGVPGILMALATLVFWMGRNRFVHIPAVGPGFLREIGSKEGRQAIGKLAVLFAFVAVFWALFDQHGTSWVFQAQDMDRNFLGVHWLESQIGAINPIFILIFVPLFTLVLYPAVNKHIKVTPLRKIGTGLFIAAGSFALISVIQQWIDAGQRPNIVWQLLAFAILTAAEVLVSIVTLEFAYTQAPRALKSLVMSFYLLSVSAGNFISGQVNHAIQIPSPKKQAVKVAETEVETLRHAGFDGKENTADDLLFMAGDDPIIESPATAVLKTAARRIEEMTTKAGGKFPDNETGRRALADLRDPWGESLRYQLRNSLTVRISSDGPDRKEKTKWDLGIILSLPEPKPERKGSILDRLHGDETWLARRLVKLGVKEEEDDDDPIQEEWYAGGQTKMEGATYFWFFTFLMLGTAILFVPYAYFYKGKTYLQE